MDEEVRTSENVEVQESKEVVESPENPIEEITEEVKKEEEVEKPKEKTVEQPKAEPVPEVVLPENIEKLVSFMKETGGTVEDYVALNKDYSKLNDTSVLYEYYSKTKPHLDQDEIAFLIEDNFNFNEDEDEARTIKKKKLAFKEEVAKAKGHLESSKEKYYDEIKLRPGVTQEQQKAPGLFQPLQCAARNSY